MKIALGMARGLEYLHSQAPPVVHSCFKTSNILLDHDLVPKIADSGVARFFPQGADKQVGCSCTCSTDSSCAYQDESALREQRLAAQLRSNVRTDCAEYIEGFF